MNSAYSLTDDAAYAELDEPPNPIRLNSAYRSDVTADVSGHSYADVSEHAYCDADAPSVAYCDADAPSSAYDAQTHSSAPSSAYYSDLSVSAQPDRTYEVIGVNNGYWDYEENVRQGNNRLGIINETLTLDYV